MIKIIPFIFFLYSSAILASTFEINPQHSQIKFEIDYMTISSVEGQFKKFKGQFEFSKETNKMDLGEIQIESNSIDTNEAKRDRHLLTKDFFETQKFPFMFVSLKSTYLPPKKRVKAEFSLEIKGRKKSEPLYITNLGSQNDPWGKPSYFFLIEGEILRKDFDLNWNRTLDKGGVLIGEKVKLKIRIEAQESGRKTPFSRYYIPATESIDNLAKIKRGEIQSKTEVEIKEPTKVIQPHIQMTVSEEKEKNSEVKDSLGNIIIGFLGFIFTSLICVFIKIKLLKKIKQDNERSYYIWEIIGDCVVLLIVFIYSVLFYQLLYPN